MIRTIRNEIVAPHGASSWFPIAPSGGSVGGSTTTDADLGACYALALTAPAGFYAPSVLTLNEAGATDVPVACRRGQVIKASARVKVNTDHLVSARLRFFTQSGAPLTDGITRDIAQASGVGGTVHQLEGYDTAPIGAYFVTLEIYTLVSGNSTFYVSEAMLVVDPWGDTGVYGEDSDWDGQEREYEDVPPFNFGYNNNVQQHADPEITSAMECKRMHQAGGRILRFALTLTLEGFWEGTWQGNPTDAWPDEDGWDATRWPAHLQAIRDAGLKCMPIVWQATPTITGAAESVALKDANATALGNMYAELLEEYADIIVAVEFHNEPNLGLFWNYTSTQTSPDGAVYMQKFTPWRQIMEDVLPDAKILAGALNHHRTTSGHDRAYESFLIQMYNNGLALEPENVAISAHPYPVVGDVFQIPYYPGPRSGDYTPPTPGSDGFWGVMNRIRSQRDAYSDEDRKLWITEFGAGKREHPKEDRWQAQLNSLTRGMAMRCDDIEGFITHSLTREGPTDTASYYIFSGGGRPYQSAGVLS